MRISDWSSDVCSSDLKSHPLAEPGDWLTMPEETFLVRLDPTTKLSDEAAEDKESRLRTLAGADGQVYGRASIWPDRYSSFFDPSGGRLTIAGLRAKDRKSTRLNSRH